jgi:hypothetical protein
MAKKSRRARSRRASKKGARTATAPSPTEATLRTPATQARATAAQGFSEQYAYVYDDLKRIAILAGTLFAVLVALSFVIR